MPMQTIGDLSFVPLGEAAEHLGDIVDGLRNSAVVLVGESAPAAALVPIELFDGFLAMERLLEYPDLLDKLRDQAAEARQASGSELGSLDDLMATYRELQGQAPEASVGL